MYVLSNWSFTPNVSDYYDQVVIPGIFTIEQFAGIQNATRNTTLYTSEDEQHLGSIIVSDDGVQTTVLIYPADPQSSASDDIRILIYNSAPTGSGPASNVAVTNWPASQNINGTVSINGEVEVKNDTGNPLTVTGTVDVGNFPATQPVSGTVDIGNEVEVKNDAGNPLAVSGTVTVDQGTSPWVVTGTTNSTVSSFPPTSTDAFGRLRVGNPYTIFDSSHRYDDNNLWATYTDFGATATFNSSQGLMDLSVGTTLGSRIFRETTKVFPYQPGKSLQVMSTFVMNAPQNGLQQRVGYFGADNGYYLELGDTLSSLCFVERSIVAGGPFVETRVFQANWNVDPMDGSGPSGITLDITKAQILWMDLEWLGVGTVRMGFVIDGQFYICHEWQHANIVTSTYITTASLPLRYEIANYGGGPGTSATLKQICSTVISEGGYSLSGTQQSIGTPILTPKTLATAGTYYPVVAIRLRSSRLDAIAIVTALSLMGNGNNEVFSWRLVNNATVTGGAWTDASSSSSVEYNLTGTSVTGGNIVGSGYFNSSNQGSPTITLDKSYLFGLQLSRDPFTNDAYSMVLEVASANNNTSVYASFDWEEVSR